MFFATSNDYTPRKIVFISLLFIWFARLGSYILFTRIVPGERFHITYSTNFFSSRDPRYEKLAESKNPYVFFFMQYELQVSFLITYDIRGFL